VKYVATVLIAAALAASACGEYYIETRLSTADPIVGGYDVSGLLYDSADNKLYIGAQSIVVVDGATGHKLERIPYGGDRLGLNPVSRRLYAQRDSLRIIDLASGAVVRRLPGRYDNEAGQVFQYCPAANKMYFSSDVPAGLGVFDGTSDSLLRTIPGVAYGELVYSPYSNKVYCHELQGSAVSIVDCTADTVISRVLIPGGSVMWRPMCYNPDDDRVYCGGDRVVLVIDCATDSTWTINYYSLRFLVYVPANHSVYALHEEFLVRIDCATDSVLYARELPVRQEGSGLYYNPSANKLYCAGYENLVVVIDCGTDSITTVLSGVPTGFLTPLCHNSRNNLVYVGGEGWGLTTAIDGARDLVATTILTAPRSASGGLCYVPSRDKVYCLYYEGAQYVFAASSVRLDRTLVLPINPSLVGHGLDDQRVYYLDTEGDRIIILGGERDTVLGIMPCEDLSYHAALVGGVDKLYCRRGDSALVAFDLTGDTLLCVVNVPHPTWLLAPDPAHSRLFVGAWGTGGQLSVLDARADSLVATVVLGPNPKSLAYSPNQNRLYEFTSDDRAYVMDCSLYQVTDTLLVPPRTEVAFWNPRNDRLYCIAAGSILMVIDCATDSVVSYQYLGEGARRLQLDTAGNRIFVTTQDYLHVVDGWGDTLVATLDIPGANFMAWCPLRRRLFISTSDTTIAVVRQAVGIEEGRKPEVTVVRGVLVMPAASGDGRRANSELLDISGRKVMSLCPGPNDVRSLSPGVYFVRPAAGVKRNASSIERMSKVVVAR
jgi:DNA-binding beta-propeller fold protein YncE